MAKFSGTIRPLEARDKQAWLPLWAGYLEFYKSSVAPEVTETTFARLADPAEPMFGLVAEENGKLVGIAHCISHHSTWACGPYLYLNDLFISPGVRGSGTGRALIEEMYRRADAIGCERVYWHTHETNATARKLYDRVATNRGFIQYQR
jgi:GNAT superfamily N-acetyltransferase